MRVNGPYIHTTGKLKGRRYVNIIHDDGRKTSMLYSRWLMQEHLGRELGRDEYVDHRDEDPTNDSIENLQILTNSENSKKSARLRRPLPMLRLTCPRCLTSFEREERHVRRSRKLGKAGPYCGRSCAGKASHER
jgi:hypothetical protein